jgi:hypothetical protein
VLGAETVIGPILKLVVTVAILAAVGIFIVKPILDTTENISHQVNESVRNSIHDTEQQTADANELSDRLATQSYVTALQGQWPAAARLVKDCVSEADTAAQLHQCRTVGERLTTVVLSDYLYAESYADSLVQQGDSEAAQRVRNCVKRAGFATAAMHHCKNLAHDLVFS